MYTDEKILKICRGVFVTFLVLLSLNVTWPQGQEALPKQSFQAEMISLTEAEILVYLLPQAQEVRKQRGNVSWELEAGPLQNTKDFYTFWVVGPRRQGEASNTIGYFSVNKHTADIWDAVLDKLISSEELQGIQKILRGGHHIDAQTLDGYRNLKPLR
jgi:hypothetical protein